MEKKITLKMIGDKGLNLVRNLNEDEKFFNYNKNKSYNKL